MNEDKSKVAHKQGDWVESVPPHFGKSASVKGWECPKCGRVYGPAVMGCAVCNGKVK